MAHLGQRRPTSRGEIDAAPAMREKFPRIAHRNDAEPVNNPRIPRTDPGASENPATQRGDLSAHQKSMQRLPHVENNDASRCVKGRNGRTHHFPRISSSATLCGDFSLKPGVLIRPKSDGKVTDIPPAVLRVP
ncbi:hypothetical protein NDU88_000009 [Pleurodeles waltl]|uniref:Uncharacterized protein n=1 Tax=Pleurodeles waltl TaxID=8319 RepID=A0AAV7UNS5_PLEWA|nr:hypothetical protein NDU88_000009 [Pleurodeles waltl]